MISKYKKTIFNAVSQVTWPSFKEVFYIGSLVVGTIIVLSIPLYFIDVSAGYLFNVIRKIVWSILDMFQ